MDSSAVGMGRLHSFGVVRLSPTVPGAWAACTSPPRTPRCRCSARERRVGTLLGFTVHDEVDPLVVEARQPGDLLALGERGAIRPDHVLGDAGDGADRPEVRET